MIYLRLFLNFLMIGALSFGGGYGMVSLVRETVLSNGWLTENEFLNIEKVVSEEKIRQLSRSIMDVLWFSLWNKAE